MTATFPILGREAVVKERGRPTLPGSRIALVCAPWASAVVPSLAISILKRCAQDAGFDAHVHLLNIRFAAMLGLKEYEAFSAVGYFAPEWFFSRTLFGQAGLGLLQNEWETIKADASAADIVNYLKHAAGGSEEECSRIATQLVPQFIDECMDTIDWGQYLAVGFTTTFAQSLSSLLLAWRIKDRYPHVKIILGGANVESEMGAEMMRGCEWVDYVVHGEGEKSFPALLRSLEGDGVGQQIAGVYSRRNGSVVGEETEATPLTDLNESPVPDYSDYIAALDRAGLRKRVPLNLYFESARGCWWGAKQHCTFCGLNGASMSYRKKHAGKVYSELMELSERYKCLNFSATDNILAMEYLNELFPRLAGKDLDLKLFYEVKANLTREQVKTLRDGYVRRVQPGIESFSSHVLKLMRKGITGIRNIQLLKWCYEYQIETPYNILYAFPGETAADYENFPRLFRLLSHLPPPSGVGSIAFERFSPYFFDREAFGLTLKAASCYEFIYPRSRINLDKIAYFFEGSGPGVVSPDDYIAPVLEAFKGWVDSWKTRRAVFYYEKGADYIVLHDTRTRTAWTDQTYRKVTLEGIAGSIYQFCDQARNVRSVREMIVKQYLGAWSDDRIRDWLEHITSQGLMWKEDDRYLALATRGRPVPRP